MITIDWSALDFEHQVQEMLWRFFILKLDFPDHPAIPAGQHKIVGILPGACEEYRRRESIMCSYYLAA